MNTQPIKAAIEAAGGQTKLAHAVGVTQGMVWQWLTGMRPVAAHRCIAIETASGGAVTRYELRPDVFGEAPPVIERAA